MRTLYRLGVPLVFLGLALGCIADIVGAPCDTSATCPDGQHCGISKTCILGTDSGGGGAGGGSGGGTPGGGTSGGGSGGGNA